MLVENISPKHVVAMYIDSLMESIKECVKALRPIALEAIIQQVEAQFKAIRSMTTKPPSKINPTTKGEQKGIGQLASSLTSIVAQSKVKIVDLAKIVDFFSKGLYFSRKEGHNIRPSKGST